MLCEVMCREHRDEFHHVRIHRQQGAAEQPGSNNMHTPNIYTVQTPSSSVPLQARPTPQSPFLTTDAAGAYLGMTGRNLERLRAIGDGPRFCKLGRKVGYRFGNTSEARASGII
jgi:hypothetical protein